MDESLLVLKGGSTKDEDVFEDLWEPLDDYEAPYREPVLPPPDFDPGNHIQNDLCSVQLVCPTTSRL